MTGTPLDLTPFGTVLQGIGLLYWVAVLAALALVLWKVKGRLWKTLLATAVLAIMVGPVAVQVMRGNSERQQDKAKLDEAIASFEARCKAAGEKIVRTVENVDGVVWMKWRPKSTNLSDQFRLDDPYGKDCGAEDCVYELLRPSSGIIDFPASAKLHPNGYRYVETVDPTDGQRYRYIGVLRQVPGKPDETFSKHVETTGYGAQADGSYMALERKPIEPFSARYGIDWDDISIREDREHWIAGSSLKVIDLQTNELIAERVGYMIDKGLGSQKAFRSPWLYAEYTACPAFDRSESNSPIKSSRSRAFVLEVLNSNKLE